MLIMLLIIKNCLNTFLREDKLSYLWKGIKSYWVKITENLIFLITISSRIMRSEWRKKLIEKLIMFIRNIGRHITMTLFLASSMIIIKKRNSSTRGLWSRRSTGKMPMMSYLHLMCTGNLWLSTTRSHYHRRWKLLMKGPIMQRKDFRLNTWSWISTKREMWKMIQSTAVSSRIMFILEEFLMRNANSSISSQTFHTNRPGQRSCTGKSCRWRVGTSCWGRLQSHQLHHQNLPLSRVVSHEYDFIYFNI